MPARRRVFAPTTCGSSPTRWSSATAWRPRASRGRHSTSADGDHWATPSRLDALGGARRFDPDDVAAIVERHRGARGSKQLATALTVHDAGAQSPRETWLRLLLLDAGFPHPRTQIPVTGSGGWPRYYLDMGWKHLLLAVEYDGEHHRTDRPSYRRDIIRMEYLQSVGWCVVRVVAGQSRADVVRRVRRAWESRLR